MYLTWTALFVVAGLAAVVSFWHGSLGARERANGAALDACERLRLQFLDGTVAFANLSLTRGHGGRLAIRRTYVFDYTADSIERRQGFVILTGRRVESVGFANETSLATPSAALAESASTAAKFPAVRTDSTAEDDAGHGRSDNVLDFAEWRRRSRQRTHADRHGGHGERKG